MSGSDDRYDGFRQLFEKHHAHALACAMAGAGDAGGDVQQPVA